MASRAHIEGTFQVRDNNLSLLLQESGEQGVSVDMLRSGMLAAAAQVLAQQKGSL